MNRYETLANAMAAEIRSGSIAVGSRMPSLRQIIAQPYVRHADQRQLHSQYLLR
jgi:DNA-binding GntR family transcriptional regulator